MDVLGAMGEVTSGLSLRSSAAYKSTTCAFSSHGGEQSHQTPPTNGAVKLECKYKGVLPKLLIPMRQVFPKIKDSVQIAQRNSLDVDVDLALGFASHYSKIGTMECLVEEGNAVAFLGPLMQAAERGCIPVVERFVQRGCRDMELCLALTGATSSSQVKAAAYLLPHVPQHVLAALSKEILKAAGERSGGSLGGLAFLLRSDVLGDPVATFAVAESMLGPMTRLLPPS